MQLTIHSADGQVGPDTTLTLGSFGQMTDFSSTAFSRKGPDGNTESLYAPPQVLPLIIQRNTARFNQDLLKHLPEGALYLDPLRDGPDRVVDHLIEQFYGRYHKLDFSLPEFVAGWARQFGQRGYSAMRKLCETLRVSRPKKINLETATLDELFENIGKDISLSALLQRFLEGDEERYFFETLGVAPELGNNRHALFEALQKYLLSGPSEHDKEVLWIAIRGLRNGGIVSPDHSYILVDFMDSVSDKDFSEAFQIIASSTLGEVLAMEEELIDDRGGHLLLQADSQGLSYEKLMFKRTPLIDQRIRAIIECLESGEDIHTHLLGLTVQEQEIVFCSLRSIWVKPGAKRAQLYSIGAQLLITALETKTILSPKTTEYLLRIPNYEQIGMTYCHFVFATVPEKDVDTYVDGILSGIHTDTQKRNIAREIFLPILRTRGAINIQMLAYVWNYCHDTSIEPYIRRLDAEKFVELFGYTNASEKKRLMILCKSQIAQIFEEVRAGNIQPYAHFIHQIITPGKQHAFDTLFGISNLFLPKKHGVTPLLPAPKPTGFIQLIKGKVAHALASVTRQHERIIRTSIQDAQKLRESLLYSFGEGYFPIGGKIHFSKPLSAGQVTLLHQVIGFGSTSFELLHADKSLNLPPCQSPLQLMAILYQLAHLGIVTDNELQLQLSVAGRVPNTFAGVLASACIFAKPHKKEYKPEAFLTSHNDLTATCICCYDAGELEKEDFSNILPHIQGRIDMLGFSNILEVLTYFILGNLISQSYFGGKFQKIGQSFISDYIQLLQKQGIASILEKKWVHTPGSERLAEEEEEHYRIVKLCTDILGADIDNYMLSQNSSGFSFQVKQLIHASIVEHKLLPIHESWAQNYLRYLNYQALSLPQ